jgi:hypothetical protein
MRRWKRVREYSSILLAHTSIGTPYDEKTYQKRFIIIDDHLSHCAEMNADVQKVLKPLDKHIYRVTIKVTFVTFLPEGWQKNSYWGATTIYESVYKYFVIWLPYPYVALCASVATPFSRLPTDIDGKTFA